ncbi:MAG: DNA polymerase I [Leptospiraceae bacterium]|nr:DNA polymerase I [Leptospiraceae bacterium]
MKLIIIDGHAFVFRAYFAFQTANLTNSITGKPSGAVFGFFKMLFKIINDFKPTHIAMPFDPGTPLERSKVFEAYKAQRKPMPEDLKPQISEVIDITRALGFPVMQIAGHEADDIIGTLCKKFGNKKNEILIFSGDKDLYQTLNPNIKMYRGTKGATEFLEIDENWVMENISITPSQVTDYMGIVGDSSDNIPGVSGIGEKGAAKLIAEYKNLEGIYKNLENIKNPSLKEKLIKNKENAFLSRDLATLKCDLEMDVNTEDLILPKYLEHDKFLEFKTRGYNRLYSDLAKQAGIKLDSKTTSGSESKEEVADTSNNAKGKYTRVRTEAELIKLVKDFQKSKLFCVDTETTSVDPMSAELLGVALSKEEGTGYYVPIAYSQSLFANNCLPLDTVITHMKPLLENSKSEKVGQNIKYDMIVLKNHGIELENVVFDTMLASYCINPGSRHHGMDDLAENYLEYKTITYDELVGTGKKKQDLFNIDPDRVTEYAAEDADITLRLYNVLKKELKESQSENTFYKMEMPLMPVLMDMEMKGISINAPYFQTLSTKFQKEIEKLEKRIHVHAGKTFNIASTKELQKVLFDELKLPAEKKTQTGYSTDHSVLEGLLGMHPIIDDLLEHRKYTKLKSTYIDTLPELINPRTKRIHTSYNQTIAATGRLSSTDPNLQNIPIKDEEGKLIRQGFVPDNKDYLLLSLDYSQIELRIMAHFADDKNMIAAYKKNADIHNETAQALFGVTAKEVTPEMRNKAKIVNFSVIYGVTAYGLSQNLKVSRQEAGTFIDKYFTQFPGVKKYMEDICVSCEEKGYVETITGRRRYIPEIKSSRRQEQESGKRIAINSPIQGTSADMIKIAMLSIHEKIEKKKLKSKLIMQVHDELVFEVHKKEKDTIFELAKKEMETALKLKVPILVQGKFGENWDEAH